VGKLPFEGLRVVDLTVYWAGPTVGRFLGQLGAEVIKIESRNAPDGARFMPPSVNNERGVNRGAMFYELNPSKLDLTLNLKKQPARDIIQKLVKVSDVVVINYAPGVAERLGLGYEVFRAVKKDIIMVEVTGYGVTGPDKSKPAFGDVVAAESGMPQFTGYGVGDPRWFGTVLIDLIAGIHAVTAVLAALEHRSRTGEGQYIDVSMLEAGLCFAPEGIMEFTMNRRTRPIIGNRDDVMVPHGYLRCRGDDKWIAIAVSTEEEWNAFCRVINHPEWLQDRRFRDAHCRRQNQDELERLIEEWTGEHDPLEITHMLQQAGVRAAPVFNIEEIINDEHAKWRDVFPKVNHPETGEMRVTNIPFKMSKAVSRIEHAPLIGEHNQYILEKILGLSKEEIESLEREGAFE